MAEPTTIYTWEDNLPLLRHSLLFQPDGYVRLIMCRIEEYGEDDCIVQDGRRWMVKAATERESIAAEGW
jgi:hypothetical protein